MPRPQRHRLPVANDLDRPLLLRVVVARALAFGAAPVVQLHHLRVHLEPVGDLVLGAEHRPVIGERKVGEVVVPDRIVQAQALVALPPGVAGPLVLLEDDRRHVQPPQPCAERDSALPAPDDHDVGLRDEAEFGLLLATLLEPRLAAGVYAVLDSPVARRPPVLLVALQLCHRRQQRPGLAADQPHVTTAARHVGLEADPAFCHAAGLAGLALELPGRGLGGDHRLLDHLAHVGVALGGGDVPGERHQVAPVAVGAEQIRSALGVAALERRTECGQPFRHLLCRRLLVHRFSPTRYGDCLTPQASPTCTFTSIRAVTSSPSSMPLYQDTEGVVCRRFT